MIACICLCLAVGMLAQSPAVKPGTPPATEDRPAEPAAEAAARLTTMRRSLMAFEVHPASDRTTIFRLLPEPILRFTNPVGMSKDGAIFLWQGEADRPEAAVQVFLRRSDELWV